MSNENFAYVMLKPEENISNCWRFVSSCREPEQIQESRYTQEYCMTQYFRRIDLNQYKKIKQK